MADLHAATLSNEAAKGAEKIRYRVTGMDCASCAQKIDTAVRRVTGVRDVYVSVGTGTLTVDHEPSLASAAVERQVRGLGYGIARADAAATDHGSEQRHAHFDEQDGGPWCGFR